MAQHEIEVILTRELASYLATAVFVVDPEGELIYYNEPAERLLGTRFDETGPMAMSDWTSMFSATDEDDQPLEAGAAPAGGGAAARPPAARALLDPRAGRRATADRGHGHPAPRAGRAGTSGAAALFWEAGEP